MNHRQIVEMADIRKSYQWLEKAGLADSTEALILAAQEQALGTRSIEAGVYHTRQDPRCRLCKEASETVQHILAERKMQPGKAFTERHNQVAVQEHLHRVWTRPFQVQVGNSSVDCGKKQGKTTVGLPDSDTGR